MNKLLKTHFERVKNYTLQVAEAMPDKDYNFKPTEEVWSFKDQIHHIGYALIWMTENYVLQAKSDWNAPEVYASKKEVLNYLKKAFDTVEHSLAKITTDESNAGFWFMLEHNAHHRGQAVTYLRCKGIAAPEFPFY